MSQNKLDNFCFDKAIMCYRTISQKYNSKSNGKLKRFKCTYDNCLKTFKNKQFLLKHGLTHQVKCNYCGLLYNKKLYGAHVKACKIKNKNHKEEKTIIFNNHKIEDYFLKPDVKNIRSKVLEKNK